MTKARTLADNFAADISGVTAGTGITGGGTSGTVTITNSMATEIDAKGDLIGGTGADTFARLAVGANGTVLTADSAETTGLKWATPAAASFVGVSLTETAAQSISNSTWTAITFTTEQFDTDSFHSNVSNTSRITIPSGKGGKYLFTSHISFNATNGTGRRQTRFYKNGSPVDISLVEIPPTSTAFVQMPNSIILDLVATDYVEVFAFQSSTISLNTYEPTVSFQAQFLGA
jgi:hypothetical protein